MRLNYLLRYPAHRSLLAYAISGFIDNTYKRNRKHRVRRECYKECVVKRYFYTQNPSLLKTKYNRFVLKNNGKPLFLVAIYYRILRLILFISTSPDVDATRLDIVIIKFNRLRKHNLRMMPLE